MTRLNAGTKSPTLRSLCSHPHKRINTKGHYHEQHHLPRRPCRRRLGHPVIRWAALMVAVSMSADRTQAMTDLSGPDHALNRSYIDWAAIAGGVVVATAIGTIFTGFGAALGLSALSAEPGAGSGTLALVLTALWMIVTLVVSYMTGGYVAGRMRRRVDQATADEVSTRDGINGLVVWGTGIIIATMLVSSAVSSTVSAAGSVVSAAATATGSALGGVVQGAAGMLPADPVAAVTDMLIRPAQVDPTTADKSELARQTASILGTAVTTGAISDADRAYLVSATAAQTGLTPAEVNTRVDAAIASAVKARDDATAMADEAKKTAIAAAETARISAVLTAFILAAAALVAAAASVIGAVKGGQHRDAGKIFGGLSFRG
jgi:hypothetical protein